MKTILFLIISFNCFAQDTIQPPCDLTRQQTRLWYNAIKLDLKLKDDQHKRETSKEIKSLKYGIRSAKIEKRKLKDQLAFQKDSLEEFYDLAILQEKKRSRETIKAERTDKKRVQAQFKTVKGEQKNDRAKIRNLTFGIWFAGIAVLLLLILSIVRYVRKKP